MTVRGQVKALVAAAGVVTVIVLTQVYTASILIFTLIVVYMFINSTHDSNHYNLIPALCRDSHAHAVINR